AMRCSGVSATEAGTMYYALYKFGRHWKFPIKRAKALKPAELLAAGELPRAIPVDTNEVNTARDWIRNADPSLEEIEQRADARPR
ncbi:MAG TPA: hypothetical protein VJ252_02360, partial [Chthoniobacterales bacterium]|nr:hypothetical protein [Chthoniobacterales bacterium]